MVDHDGCHEADLPATANGASCLLCAPSAGSTRRRRRRSATPAAGTGGRAPVRLIDFGVKGDPRWAAPSRACNRRRPRARRGSRQPVRTVGATPVPSRSLDVLWTSPSSARPVPLAAGPRRPSPVGAPRGRITHAPRACVRIPRCTTRAGGQRGVTDATCAPAPLARCTLRRAGHDRRLILLERAGGSRGSRRGRAQHAEFQLAPRRSSCQPRAAATCVRSPPAAGAEIGRPNLPAGRPAR